MRKLIIICIMCMLMTLSAVIVACDNKQEQPHHEHTYSNEWSSDDTHHWHAATCEHTDLVKDRTEHNFDEYKCVDCDYEIKTEGLEYKLNRDGNSYSVVGIGSATEAHIIIPYIYNGKPVTSIGDGAFQNCDSLESVAIGEGIIRIDDLVFYDCDSLIGIKIPDSVTSIGYGAFMDCDSLESVIMGDSVTSIGDNAFTNCSSLVSITIPDSVTSIGERAFYNCSSLQYNIFDNAMYLGNDSNPYLALIEAKKTDIVSCVINDNTKVIAGGAFKWCNSLDNITIPNSVTSIGNYTFFDCSSLENITIPDSVTSIGQSVFDGCSSLESITIPDSITSIGQRAFDGCSSLKSITIPDSVTNIGDYAFDGCSSLESITIPDSVTSMGSYVFNECYNLRYNEYDNWLYLGNDNNPYVILIEIKDTDITSCVINDKTKFIHSDVFRSCSNLESIIIPDSVESIGYFAFQNCYNLEIIFYKGTADEWGSISISSGNYNLTAATTIYYYSEIEPSVGKKGKYDGNYWHYDENGEPAIWRK
ncbi:MAG: leucine-rich repeat protein [Clostridiales bacterium]|nr:leucine-rich repeat protein [Clostridiales bacterium]